MLQSELRKTAHPKDVEESLHCHQGQRLLAHVFFRVGELAHSLDKIINTGSDCNVKRNQGKVAY